MPPSSSGLNGRRSNQGGLVWVEGPDAARFVHRLSTQHTEGLTPHDARLNAFLNRKGRMVALCLHVVVAPERIALMTHGTPAKDLAAWLETFHFMEDVTLRADETPLSLDGGPRSDALAPWSASVSADGAAIVARTFDVLAPDDAPVPTYLAWGAAPVAAQMDPAAYEAAALRAGVPVWPSELCDAYNPLELELHDALHWDKGCFTGQEVIARIDNYDKQTRTLVALSASGPGLAAGQPVTLADKAVGVVTRVGPYIVGQTVALAMLKKSALDAEGLRSGAVDVELRPRAAAQTPKG